MNNWKVINRLSAYSSKIQVDCTLIMFSFKELGFVSDKLIGDLQRRENDYFAVLNLINQEVDEPELAAMIKEVKEKLLGFRRAAKLKSGKVFNQEGNDALLKIIEILYYLQKRLGVKPTKKTFTVEEIKIGRAKILAQLR